MNDTTNHPSLSLVIPVLNEVESLPTLHRELTAVCNQMGAQYEIIFVNDGSADGSAACLNELAATDAHVKVIHFRRNFGKSSALAAAFQRIQGEIVLTLDADLQDDPKHIPEFVAKIQEGADLVSGWKLKRHDPLSKKLPSRLFNFLVRRASGIQLHDFNCGFKAYTRECIEELDIYGGFHRFLPVLAGNRGYRVEELIVEHRPREHGVSKFGGRRFYHGLADLMTMLLITRYRTSPLHLFGKPGMVMGGIGFVILLYLSAIWFMGQPIGTRPLLLFGVLLMLMGGLFTALGLLGELIVHSSYSSRAVYSIRPEHEARDRTRPRVLVPAERPPKTIAS